MTKEIEAVAKERFVTEAERRRFVRFMKSRFPKERSSAYIDEWAGRVRSGDPYKYADPQTTKALKRAGYTESGWFGERRRHAVAARGRRRK